MSGAKNQKLAESSERTASCPTPVFSKKSRQAISTAKRSFCSRTAPAPGPPLDTSPPLGTASVGSSKVPTAAAAWTAPSSPSTASGTRTTQPLALKVTAAAPTTVSLTSSTTSASPLAEL